MSASSGVGLRVETGPLDMGPLSAANQNIDALSKWFGANWTWSEIAAWIEVRSRSAEMPRFAVLWASDFLETRRKQEEAWND